MEFFRRNNKELGRDSYLVFAVFLLAGCAGQKKQAIPVSGEEAGILNKAEEEREVAGPDTAPDTNTDTDTNVDTASYVLLHEDLIQWDQVKETETEDYYIVAVQEENEDGEMEEYPQIVSKEGKEIYCGTEQINELLKTDLSHKISPAGQDYTILYADQHYISVWKGNQKKTTAIYVINLQCPVVCQGFLDAWLFEIQDDNDYRNAPWPSNGITLSMDAVLEEIERGNCYTDERGYALYRENPQAFLDSARRQFAEIKAGGYEEAYWIRLTAWKSKKAYRMYLREGRVGFYIHPIEVWEEAEQEKFYQYRDNPIDTSRDFRIEVAYDWQKDAPVYHMPYEVYGEQCESEEYGSFYYPQIRGLDETVTASLNAAMKKDLDENLAYMDLNEWNERMSMYGYERYWDELPRLRNPNVTYQTEKYLCIWQDVDVYEDDRFRMAEDWKRYHVYDVETGQSLKLGDMIRLDEDFVMWLKQEKKIEATYLTEPGEWWGTSNVYEPEEWLKEELDDYPAEILLAELEEAEIWLKDGSLFVRLPRYNEERYGGMVYWYGGNACPSFLQYYMVRMGIEDIQEFLLAEPWGE